MSNHSLLLVAALLGATACAQLHAGSGRATGSAKASDAKVADSDFARIPARALAPVEAARAEAVSSHDATIRADGQIAMADKRVEVAKAQIGVRKSEGEAAKAQFGLATSSGERGRIETAQQALARAEAAIQLAAARAELVQKERDRVALDGEVAHRQERAAEAKVELAKLDALRASGDASADRYDHRNFEEALSVAQIDVKRAQDSVQDDTAIRLARDRVAQAKDAFERAGGEKQPVRGVDPADEYPE